jgi:hypothetical protein
MAAYQVAADWSYFQRVLSAAYKRRVGIFRCTFSPDFPDPNFLANANQAHLLYSQGHADGFILYTVFLPQYTPAQQYDAFWRQVGPKVPDWMLGVMGDVESWRGQPYQINGNHSAAFNNLMGRHAHQMGSWNAVPWYGNAGDLAEIIPQRDPRMWGILAAYTGKLQFKAVKGARGQQYTNGQITGPRVGLTRLPTASAPFGNIDHNYLDFKSGAALRAFMRPATKPPVAAKPVATHPAPEPVSVTTTYDATRGSTLVSSNGQYRLILGDRGGLGIQKNGKTVHVISKGN